jgi:macro domain-containing protein
VFATSGGEDFQRIFHAGFHEPYDWPDDARTTDYFEAIGFCTTQILHSADQQGLKSVAFPLIGCGIFGLDEKMLIEQFLEAIETFDTQAGLSKPLNVWLVIRDYGQFESTVGKLRDMLLSARRGMVAVQLDLTHVPILDGFSEKRLEPIHKVVESEESVVIPSLAPASLLRGAECGSLNTAVLPTAMACDTRVI